MEEAKLSKKQQLDTDTCTKVNAANLVALMAAMEKESDRGLVLLGTSYLDAALVKLLYASFVDHAAIRREALSDGPLDTFSSRIKIAYLMGLITDQVRKDLNLIRNIRNDFAHRIAFHSMSQKAVASRVLNLKTGSSPNWKPGSMRRRFEQCATALLADIYSAANSVEARTHLSGPPESTLWAEVEEIVATLRRPPAGHVPDAVPDAS